MTRLLAPRLRDDSGMKMMAQSGRRWNPERAQRPDNINASAYNLHHLEK